MILLTDLVTLKVLVHDVTRGYDFNKGGRAGKAEGGIMGTKSTKSYWWDHEPSDQRQG